MSRVVEIWPRLQCELDDWESKSNIFDRVAELKW